MEMGVYPQNQLSESEIIKKQSFSTMAWSLDAVFIADARSIIVKDSYVVLGFYVWVAGVAVVVADFDSGNQPVLKAVDYGPTKDKAFGGASAFFMGHVADAVVSDFVSIVAAVTYCKFCPQITVGCKCPDFELPSKERKVIKGVFNGGFCHEECQIEGEKFLSGVRHRLHGKK